MAASGGSKVVNRGGLQNNVGVQPGPVLGYHFATLGEQHALAEGGSLVFVSVPGPLRVRFQRRSH